MEELINHVMKKAHECYHDDFPIHKIEDWIREFFHQKDIARKQEDAAYATALSDLQIERNSFID
jgi:hypothetical protein